MRNQEQTTGAVKLDARAYPFDEPKGKQLAFASVTINGCFAVTGIKIMDGGEKGPFVAMPSMICRESPLTWRIGAAAVEFKVRRHLLWAL